MVCVDRDEKRVFSFDAAWIFSCNRAATRDALWLCRNRANQDAVARSGMRSIGLTNLSHSDTETQAYLSPKFLERDNVFIDSKHAATDRRDDNAAQ
jgi:hypothetical protein